MKKLIAANWKMNPASSKEARNIFNNIKKRIKGTKSEIVICPPFIYLSLLKGLTLGAQDVFYEERGAFTGEISAAMLKDMGVKYVIIGHSERRKYFSETDEIINKKIKKAVDAGLKVIFCVGETQEQHDAGKRNEILEKQIKNGLANVDEKIENINIAYEPVWAIGTGNNCSVEETKEAVELIRRLVKTNTRIIYGGSVKSENSGRYIKKAGVDGLLVGGASLDAKEFIKIINSIEE